jgi:uncharacterized protein
MKQFFKIFALLVAGSLATHPEPVNAGEPVLREAGGGARTAEQAYREGLALLRQQGRTEAEDQRVFGLFQEASDGGIADAVAAVAFCYCSGVGVQRDEAHARDLYRQAAEAGSVEGKVNFGRMLVDGRGGEKDIEGGLVWIEKAASADSAGAGMILAEIYYFGQHSGGEPDYRRAYEIALELARQGNARAQNMVGVILRDGLIPGEGGQADAERWFASAASQKEPKACSNLGHLGHQSKDRERRIEALKWLVVARELGEITAKYTLLEREPFIEDCDMDAAESRARAFLEIGE